MNYDLLTEKLMGFYAGSAFKSELDNAKQEFFERAGIFDEEATDFEMKMAQFVDWYLFGRRLNQRGCTPLEEVLVNKEVSLIPEEKEFVENMKASRHSLFEFLKLKGEDVYILDLLSDQKYIIKKSPVTVGFNKDQIFEARVFPVGDSFMFSKAFCVHPSEATKFILKEVKKIKKMKDEQEKKIEREALILRLFKMKYKHQQYKHVNVLEIYSNEPKLRI